jgi:hypothetical protein
LKHTSPSGELNGSLFSTHHFADTMPQETQSPRDAKAEGRTSTNTDTL